MEIIIPSDRIVARLKGTMEETKQVKEILSYSEKQYTGKRKIEKDGVWRTVKSFKKVKRSVLRGNLFLAGLVPRVQKEFKGKCEIVEENKEELVYEPFVLKDVELREYQADVLYKIIEQQRGIVVFPTGSGKTVMMAALIAALPLKFMVIVQKLDLLKQTVDKLSTMLGEEVGYLGGGAEEWKDITVCSIQTLKSRDYDIPFISGLIVDEVHHAGAPSYLEVLNKIGSDLRIGFTATEAFIPSKQLQIEGIFGPVLATMPYENLAEMGMLAKGNVEIHEIPCNPDVYTMSATDWNALYYAGIVINPERNSKIAIISKDYSSEGKKVLVIVNRIEHGDLLQGMCGEHSVFVNGGSDSKDRDAVAQSLAKEGGRVVISTNIFDEGMDFPELDVVVLARGWESPIATVQSGGRGSRVTDTKKSFTVVDFYDRSHRVLKKHSDSRIKVYKSKGWEVTTHQKLQKKSPSF